MYVQIDASPHVFKFVRTQTSPDLCGVLRKTRSISGVQHRPHSKAEAVAAGAQKGTVTSPLNKGKVNKPPKG